MAAESIRVSPTAYATGELWVRLGLSDPRLSTPEGQRLIKAFGWLDRSVRVLGGGSMADLLEARHRAIDARLANLIETGAVGQIVELAAGFSGRGLRLTRRFPGLHYLETDLPHMVARKKALLAGVGERSAGHRQAALDALAHRGPESLEAVLGGLEQGIGTAVVAEGLLNYLPPAVARRLFTRIGTVLQRFPRGQLLCDAYLPADNLNPGMAAFGLLLMGFVRGRLHLPFRSAAEARRRLGEAGFDEITLWPAAELAGMAGRRGARRVRIVEARRLG